MTMRPFSLLLKGLSQGGLGIKLPLCFTPTVKKGTIIVSNT